MEKLSRNENRLGRLWEEVKQYCIVPRTDMEKLLGEKKLPIIEKGEGMYFQSISGNKYIDASSGPHCSNIGHGNKKVKEAITHQVEELEYAWYARGLHEPMIALSKKIASLTPDHLNKVRLATTGCDGIEIALKMVRLREDRDIVISLVGGFHGTTLGAASATGMNSIKDLHRQNIAPGVVHIPPPNCYRCPYGLDYPDCDILCARMLENEIANVDGKVAAFLAEPILGVGGGITPPPEYWPIISDICHDYNVPLVLDEVQTGPGRTGKMFGFEHWDIEPDMIILAKGLASMYQTISAVVVSDDLYGRLKELGVVVHSHTASCHPVACSAATANLDFLLEKDLVQNAKQVGSYLREQLENLHKKSSIVGDVRGKGLMQAIEIVKDKGERTRFQSNVSEIIEDKCRENGMLITPSGYNNDAFRIGPPLTSTKEDIDKICGILSQVLSKTEELKLK